jgi:hypothetical protein
MTYGKRLPHIKNILKSRGGFQSHLIPNEARCLIRYILAATVAGTLRVLIAVKDSEQKIYRTMRERSAAWPHSKITCGRAEVLVAELLKEPVGIGCDAVAVRLGRSLGGKMPRS